MDSAVYQDFHLFPLSELENQIGLRRLRLHLSRTQRFYTYGHVDLPALSDEVPPLKTLVPTHPATVAFIAVLILSAMIP